MRDFFERYQDRIEYGAPTGCWLWSGAASGKQQHGLLTYEQRNLYAHRCAYEAAFGSFSPDMVVRHRCDTPACVNPNHLALGTKKDNGRDMRERGRSLVGERNTHAKLSDKSAAEIKRRVLAGERQQSLADEFGVNRVTVSDIKRGKRWRHL